MKTMDIVGKRRGARDWFAVSLIPWIDMRYYPILFLLTLLACAVDNKPTSTVDSVDSAIEIGGL